MLDFTIQLADTNLQLRRIAEALERISPPIPEDTLNFKKRGPKSLITYGGEAYWKRKRALEEIRSLGLSPEEEGPAVDQLLKDAMELPTIDE